MSQVATFLRVWCMTISSHVAPLRSLVLILAVFAATTSCGSTSDPIVPPPAPPPPPPPPPLPPPPPPPPAAVATVELSATTATLEIGGTTTLTATPRDATGTALTGRPVTWSTDAPAVATVTNGLVTAVSAGLATITATSEGKSAAAAITVNAPPPPPPACESTTPTGRLVADGVNGPYHYITSGGWRIEINVWTITIRDPSDRLRIENWGDGANGAAMGHENLNGKHVKDFLGMRRSHLLPDGTLVTFNGVIGDNEGQVTIYDNDQTHRLIGKTGAPSSTRVLWSCPLPNFREAEEADGETSRIVNEGTGFLWENIYQQETNLDGSPGAKMPDVYPLARTIFANPNQVLDYYDDARLGHT